MNVLVLYDKFSTYTNTVYEHLKSFSDYSSNTHTFYHGLNNGKNIPWDKYDIVVIHYSLRVAHGHIHLKLLEKLEIFKGAKVLFVQDEYENTERTKLFIENYRLDVVFTCIPDIYREEVYSASRFPHTQFIHTLTGFAPEVSNTELNDLPLIAERHYDVVYRGRALPFHYGDLGQEKKGIAVGVKRFCQKNAVSCNVEWDDQHRIYGDAWIDFLKQGKSTLGTESGSNIFDNDGSIKKEFEKFLQENPEATYLEARKYVLKGYEERPIMNQISPRVFEAIACKTALILFEGGYSGIIKPNKHFLPLKKDFSNISEIFDKLADEERIQKMVNQAYHDIIESKKYTFRSFINQYDEVVNSMPKGKMLKKVALSFPKNFHGVTNVPERVNDHKLPAWLRVFWDLLPISGKQFFKEWYVKVFS